MRPILKAEPSEYWSDEGSEEEPSMKRLLLVTLLIWASACGKSYSPSPVAPTPAQTPALPPHSMLQAPIVSMGSIPAHPVQNQVTTFRLAFSVKNGVIAKSV